MATVAASSDTHFLLNGKKYPRNYAVYASGPDDAVLVNSVRSHHIDITSTVGGEVLETQAELVEALAAIVMSEAAGGGGGGGDASAANQTAGNTLLGPVTETAPATDTASSGLNGRLQRLAQTLTAHTALKGAVTETAPASDTASSGLNGRLQRLAQHLSTLISYFKAEDSAHTTADIALPVLTGIRKDVAATLVGTDQDYTFFQFNNAGGARVEVATALPAGTAMLGHFGGVEYEAVAASATDQILGATGAVNDYLRGVLVVPATTSPGAVAIKDGNGSAITVFTGGTVADLTPFFIPIGAKCLNATTAGWKVTTGTNVSAVGFGDFT